RLRFGLRKTARTRPTTRRASSREADVRPTGGENTYVAALETTTREKPWKTRLSFASRTTQNDFGAFCGDRARQRTTAGKSRRRTRCGQGSFARAIGA